MGVDSGYGTGAARSAANSASRRNSAASAGLRKKGIKKAGRNYTSTATAKAKSVSGSSDYVARENAARTQLGTAGVAARARQFPTAARATARGLLREFTGVDISRKGVSVSPESLAMALPIGKLIKAKNALVAAGKIKKASAVEARILANKAGKETSRFGGSAINDVAMRKQSTSVFPRIADTANNTPTLRQEYLAAKRGYEQVFGRGSKMGSFNPDVAAMTSYPGQGPSVAKIRKISNQVDAYLAKRGRNRSGR